MPSKNMLPKGHRHRTVRPEYVATRGVEPEMPAVVPVVEFDDDGDAEAVQERFRRMRLGGGRCGWISTWRRRSRRSRAGGCRC